MGPILIDEAGIKRLGVISVVTFFLVFMAGYYFGHQQTGLHGETGDVVPGISEFDTTAETDISLPAVDQDTVASTNPDPDQQESAIIKAVDEKKSIDIISVKHAIESPVAMRDIQEEKKEKKNKAEDTSVDNQQSEAIEDKADDNTIRYSIQTAVYGQPDRAERNMNDLLARNIQAYVTDSVNRNNKTWYNVRFGYFKDKKSALSALEDYKRRHGGDGYLVNFSAERIVDFDEQKFYDDSIDEKSGAVSKSSVTSEKSLSQSDVTPASVSGQGSR